MLHILEELHPGMHVLIKPNLLLKRRPEEATTTHPAVVEAIILCLKRLGIHDITIADSPGGPFTKVTLGPIYEASGMAAVAARTGASLNYNCSSYEQESPNGIRMKRFTLISPVKEADYIINVPKLKTHGMMTLSGGVKNLFGTVPGLLKPELHWRFPETEAFAGMLLDLAQTVSPNLTICDGIVSMEGDGPSGGIPRQTGMLIGSKSPFLLDGFICKAISLSSEKVPTVCLSVQRGLCPSDFDTIEIIGDKYYTFTDFALPQSKSVDFTTRLPKPFRPMVNRILRSRPIIRKEDCIGCGKCAESCPAKTIRIKNGKAQIEYDSCIRCFCCHEMCPVKAVDIHQFRLFRF